MATKPITMTIAPLQRVVATPVTDRAKLAALDKARKRVRRTQRKSKASRHAARARTTSRMKKGA
jgi:hypothetical protein